MRVLILGFGRLGSALARRHGFRYDFRGIRRTPIESPPCPVVNLALQDPALQEHLAWADHLVFCPSASGPDESSYRAAYLDNMIAVTRTLTSAHITPRSVILIGSTGVYPNSVDDPIDETLIPTVESERQRILLQTEHALAQSGYPHVILRCAGLYGEGPTTFRERLADGRINSTMLTNQYVHFVHVHDVCSAIDLVIQRNLSAEIFNLVDDSRVRRREFYEFLASLYGLPIQDRGQAPADLPDRLISNSKVKDRLKLTLYSPSIIEYLTAETRGR